nr:alpha/beta hydrolase [uncultured Draconibacterium sp.]
MNKLLFGITLLLISCSLQAQQTVVSLYNGMAPGSENWTQKEVEYTQWGGKMVRNVVDPTLTVFLPEEDKATGAAVVVAPGGGFVWLSLENEGTQVGKWLQEHGIAAFVLKYRLADTGPEGEDVMTNAGEFLGQMMSVTATGNPEAELAKYPKVENIIALAEEDGRQAVKYIRANAAKYNIKQNRIGIMGFSAGGVVTMGVALKHDAESRPDFVAPIYGFAIEKLVVPEDAAPMFMACAADDANVASKAGGVYKAWLDAGKSVEFHVYSKGGHGFGMRKQDLPVDNWINQFYEWMNIQGFLNGE